MVRFAIPLVLILSTLAQALLVVQSSPQCAELCGNTLDRTSGSEITCTDSGYSSSTYGAAFKACLACEMGSTYFDPKTKISDLHWAIYNLRFALSWCLFGWENNTQAASTPCVTSFSCGPLQSAFEYDSLSPNSTSYSFCPLLPSVTVPKCTSCLREMNNERYLANFVIALQAACEQQPVPGGTLSLQGSLFSTTSVNITVPSATLVSTYNPSTGGLTLGSKIGIATGALLVLLATTGFCIVWCGKRRRRRVLAEKARENGYQWQAHHGVVQTPTQHDQPFFDSPQSQRPFAHAWQDHESSPASATVEKAYFSPYSSQYTSPVSGIENPTYQQGWPRDSKKTLSPDGPSHAAEWPRDNKRGFSHVGVQDDHGEGIEMTGIGNPDAKTWNAAPVLSHPGHGRPILTDDDVKKGYGL